MPAISASRLEVNVTGVFWRLAGSADVGDPAVAASHPARKPRRLASTALPSARIAASNASAGMGSARAGDRAEQHRVDHGIGLPGDRFEIEEQRLARIFLDRRDQALWIVAAIAHRDLFDDEIGAAG